jgi:hypothetical protein
MLKYPLIASQQGKGKKKIEKQSIKKQKEKERRNNSL